MKKMIILVVLGVAMMGGVYLVQRNQNIGRKASEAETGVMFLPASTTLKVGESRTITVVVNTGKETDKLRALDLVINYDNNKLEFEDIVPLAGMSLIENESTAGEGKLRLAMVAMGVENQGSVQVARINFKGSSGGSGEINLVSGKILVRGQKREYGISFKQPAKYTVTGGEIKLENNSKVGDINKDGKVNLDDYLIITNEATGKVSTKQGDLNKDGMVNSVDIIIWKRIENSNK